MFLYLLYFLYFYIFIFLYFFREFYIFLYFLGKHSQKRDTALLAMRMDITLSIAAYKYSSLTLEEYIRF